MHKVRSLLVLALVSALMALGLVAASPGIAVGNPGPDSSYVRGGSDLVQRVVNVGR